MERNLENRQKDGQRQRDKDEETKLEKKMEMKTIVCLQNQICLDKQNESQRWL